MSKRKAKVSQEKIRKIEIARHRNEFLRRLQDFCEKVSDHEVFGLIPEKELESIYEIRIRPIQVKEAPGHHVSPAMLKEFRSMISATFKFKVLPFEVGQLSTVSVYDFYTVGLALLFYAERIKGNEFHTAAIVKAKLAPLVEMRNTATFDKLWNEHAQTANLLNILYNDIGSELYFLKPALKADINGVPGVNLCMEAYSLKTEKKEACIDGINRPVFRVGWPIVQPNLHLEYVKLPSKDLNKLPGLFLDVYIQQHALNRLHERIGNMPVGFLHYNIFDSLKNLKVCTNKKGQLLIEYAILKKKVGYFVADIIDGRVILRTFLFLTNNGTPEGERLHANTGIAKEDKIYLTIDVLSTFVESDISNNKKLKDIFIKTGCESLFEIAKEFYFTPPSQQEKPMADFIAKYLNISGSA